MSEMKKIKGQGTITKLLTTKRGLSNKEAFSKYITSLDKLQKLSDEMHNDRSISIDVVSFSSSNDFNEQVLSILSFIKNVGQPLSWTIHSDGSHSERQIALIQASFTFLNVIKTEFDKRYIDGNIKNILVEHQEEFIDYANKFPLGKKLFLYLNTQIRSPTIFLDSDVLFYKKASCLYDLIKENFNGWFLPDAEWGNLDSRYVAANNPQHYQVNAGFFLVNTEIEKFSTGLNFLKNLKGNYEYFSEQTIMHILLLENSFMPLDPRIFALNSDDQFDFSYLYDRRDIAIRHYTGPVRHKMWQRDWKWHLSLS